MNNPERNKGARESILNAIRENLVASRALDAVNAETKAAHHDLQPAHDKPRVALDPLTVSANGDALLAAVELFGKSLQAVDGHCVTAHGVSEVVAAIDRIVADLQGTRLHVRRIAISDSPVVAGLVKFMEPRVEEIAVSPSAADLFGFDLGITTVQAAIAETGTLVLDSDHERHRLVSLVPPVHIAILEASQIFVTLGEALAALHSEGETVTPLVTFVTGPSRTADIELTLAIGVHGPQELHVIVNTGPPLVA